MAEAEAEAEAEVRAKADLRILRQPVAPLRLQRLLVSSAPRLRQLVGVGAVLRAHGHRASDAAEPPQRERRHWTGVQAGGAPQAEQEAGGDQMHSHRGGTSSQHGALGEYAQPHLISWHQTAGRASECQCTAYSGW